MKKIVFASASMFLLGSTVLSPALESQIVRASERVYISETSGLYTAQYGGTRKSSMKPSFVNVVETGTDGWYKASTWLGDLWVKNGFQETKSPEKPVEYAYITAPSALFKEINKGKVSSLTPQRVVLIQKGDNGWMQINTWLGALWVKNGVMEEEQTVTEEIIPEKEDVQPMPEVETNPPVVETEPVAPEVVEETPPVVEEPIPAPAEPVTKLKTKYINDLFDVPNGNRLGSVSAQTLNVVEVGTDGWFRVATWLGPVWIKDGFLQNYTKPVIPNLEETGTIPFLTVSFPEKDGPIGFYTITQSSGMYSDPSTAERLGVVNPQRVYLIEKGPDGWVKINSNWGQVWVKDGFNGYRSYFAKGATFRDAPNGRIATSVNASYINIVEERADGWKRVQTWLGDKWTNDPSIVVPIRNAADTSLPHIYVTKDTAIMEKMMYEYKQVGIAKGGQTYVLLSETDQSYTIDFGYGVGHIKKSDAQPTDTANYVNRTVKTELNDVLITKKDAIVYDLKGVFYHQVGMIEENMRYPIVNELVHFYVIDFGGREGYIAKSSAVKDTTGVPALMYHHFLEPGENITNRNISTTITPAQFDREMAILKQQGFTTITPEMMESYVLKKGNLPGKSVIITSDDAYKSNFRYMYPTLKKYGLQGTIFTITGWTQIQPVPWRVDSKDFMSVGELSEAATSGALNFHGHTNLMHYSNNGLGAIASEPYEEIVADTKLSKEKLEYWGHKPRAFAYPLGSYNQMTINAMKEAGYTSAYTIKPGYNKPGDSIYELKRWDIKPWVSDSEFIEIINGRN